MEEPNRGCIDAEGMSNARQTILHEFQGKRLGSSTSYVCKVGLPGQCLEGGNVSGYFLFKAVTVFGMSILALNLSLHYNSSGMLLDLQPVRFCCL